MTTTVNAYFRKLCALLGNVAATDRAGVPVSIDQSGARAVDMIEAVRQAGGKVMLVGNGGSAAIVAHMHNDLCKAVGVRALVFTEPSLLTAYTNDDGYETAYAQQVDHWADRGDLLIAVSSSGQSENILRAVAAARRHGVDVVTMTGFAPDNSLRLTGDLNFYVADQQYGCVELAHAVLMHYLTDAAADAATNLAQDRRDESDSYDIRIETPGVGDGRRGVRGRRASA